MPHSPTPNISCTLLRAGPLVYVMHVLYAFVEIKRWQVRDQRTECRQWRSCSSPGLEWCTSWVYYLGAFTTVDEMWSHDRGEPVCLHALKFFFFTFRRTSRSPAPRRRRAPCK